MKVTISLGIATIVPKKGQHQVTLIKAADMALYQAKALGRNTVVTQQGMSKIKSVPKAGKNSNVKPFKKT